MGNRALLVLNGIAPYQIPLLNKIVETTSYDIDVVSVRGLTKEREKLGWDFKAGEVRFRYEMLREVSFSLLGKPVAFSPGIVRSLVKQRYDVVLVGGYFTLTVWLVVLWSKLRRSKIILRFATHKKCERSPGFLARLLKKAFLRAVDYYVAYGTLAQRYLIELGADPERISVEYNTVDVDTLRTECEKRNCLKMARRQAQKQLLGLPYNVVLYVGQLVSRKNIKTLLEATKSVQDNVKDFGLVIIGEGRQRHELECYALDNEIENVFFKGAMNFDQLKEYYMAADAFVLLSTNEPWGLVVNEAMSFGCPIIVSSACGCSSDLVYRNGWIIGDPGDHREVASRIQQLITNTTLRHTMGRNSFEKVAQYNIRNAAQAINEALERCTKE